MAQTDPRGLSKLPSSVITVISTQCGAIHDPRSRSGFSLRPRGFFDPCVSPAIPPILRLSDPANTSPSWIRGPVHVLRSHRHHPSVVLLSLPSRPPAMPYVDLLHPSDAVSIWYTSSSRLGTVNSLQPEKPTIVILHPLYLNSSWLWAQMDDHRLNSSYNMIAFDTRTSGKSMSAPSGMYDTWVQAADLALCFQVRMYPHSRFFSQY